MPDVDDAGNRRGLGDADWLRAQLNAGRSVVDVAGAVGRTPRAVRTPFADTTSPRHATDS